jgi:DNA-nicking Smr family endonuclease
MARRRVLHAEDQELWHMVARSLKPLHPQKTQPIETTKPPQVDAPAVRIPAFRVGQAQKMGSTANFAPSARETLSNAPLRMDAKTHAKMTRGKLAPEARIDLHGMTLDQAHGALNGFIMRAHGAGLRLVLVITGKGKRGDDTGTTPQRTGVLRTQVPHWLHQMPLAPMILQVTEAHGSHGGGGALYVYLRRR